MITHKSGHMGAVNQRALEKAGIRADTPDPEGGHIGRVEARANQAAIWRKRRSWPWPRLCRRRSGGAESLLQQAEREYLKYGVTTVQDGLLQEQGFNLMRDTPLHVDAVGFADLKQSPTLLKEHPEYCKGYRDHFRLGGYKIILDGSPQAHSLDERAL